MAFGDEDMAADEARAADDEAVGAALSALRERGVVAPTVGQVRQELPGWELLRVTAALERRARAGLLRIASPGGAA